MRDKEGKKISYTHIKEFATVLVIVKRVCFVPNFCSSFKPYVARCRLLKVREITIVEKICVYRLKWVKLPPLFPSRQPRKMV